MESYGGPQATYAQKGTLLGCFVLRVQGEDEATPISILEQILS